MVDDAPARPGGLFGYGSKERGFLHGLPGPAKLVAWAGNLQAEFLAWLLNAPRTEESYGFPQTPLRCHTDKIFIGKSTPPPPSTAQAAGGVVRLGTAWPSAPPTAAALGFTGKVGGQWITCLDHSQLVSPQELSPAPGRGGCG